MCCSGQCSNSIVQLTCLSREFITFEPLVIRFCVSARIDGLSAQIDNRDATIIDLERDLDVMRNKFTEAQDKMKQ